jgi:hypothetical protein
MMRAARGIISGIPVKWYPADGSLNIFEET